MAITIATTGRNATCDRFVDLIDLNHATNSGTLRIYTAGGATQLCSIQLARPAFTDAVVGVATARTGLTGQVTADGTAAVFGVYDAGGSNWIFSGTIGAEMTLSNTSLLSGDTISITWNSSTITMPAS